MQHNPYQEADAIQSELLQLGEFYGIRDEGFREQVESLDLGHYIEIVLNEQGFELVTGGVGRESALIAEARAAGYPQEIIESFAACTHQFPRKMLYSKVGFGPNKAYPSMYLCLIEPWESVSHLLKNLPGFENDLNNLPQITNERRICFSLGFSKHRESGELMIKTYQLYPRAATPAQLAPVMISHRLTRDGEIGERKTYTIGVSWDHFVHSTRWSEIAAFGETLFGNKYVMIRSESAAGKAKGYVFRFDKRQNASFSLKTYNHYVDEGYRLYQLGQIPAAIESLTDAIAFNLNTQVTLAQNYNNRGLLYFSIREFHKALADFKKAIELEEKLATAHNNIAGVLLQLGDYEEAIYAASTALFYDPNTDDTNLNVAKRLLRQAELEG